ncbi:MAG: methanogenesis marker 12 protein, partial [Candidatus Syntropharchaeia archaeon]
MFLGIDHGTRGIRFACEQKKFEIQRKKASLLSHSQILRSIEEGLFISLPDVKLAALTYSMGDGISKITDIRKVSNRGIKSNKGAGKIVGGGTKIFDAIKESGIPAVVIPGIHAEMDIDPRMKVFSHSASPEKVGCAYLVYKMDFESFILCDISSNTVTIGVANGRILGGIDAPIFAPGMYQGPLDLKAIREVDEGLITANEAFSGGGIAKVLDPSSEEGIDALSLFASMEIAAMQLLVEDYARDPEIFITGSAGENPRVKQKIEKYLGKKV